MLRNTSATRTLGLLVSTAVVALGATSATASAAQTLCIGPAGSGVTVADADGSCKAKNATAKTLVEQSELDAEKAKVAALEDKLSKVSYNQTGLNGKPTLKIDGANLQITNGSGSTAGIFGAVNGLGNLFIGYNEPASDHVQTGSHNLIIGRFHSFTSHSGLVAGSNNKITGTASSVTGGQGNTASGPGTSVSGGSGNTASDFVSWVSGGALNTASGSASSVTGGRNNNASGGGSSVSGGRNNDASGPFSSILGGDGITLGTEGGTYPAGP